jgi:hypothetical protein
MKQLDWGPNTSVPYVFTMSLRYLCRKEIERSNLIRFEKDDFDSRNSPHQNHHPNHMQTPFWTFFIWMESKEDKISNGQTPFWTFFIWMER